MSLLKCPQMSWQKEKWIAGAIILIFLLMITAPYLYAANSSDEGKVFGGFLLNPIDGNSYLAKMRQGYEGNWMFTLPYTKDPGEGTAINLYYLFLGHVSRFMSWSLIFTFHLARVLGAFLLSLVTYRLFRTIFAEANSRLIVFALAVLGSGLGWAAAAFGLFTSDFWVAEAYPFLASFANAHFPFGLALQIGLLTPLFGEKSIGWRFGGFTFLVAALLSIVYPFGWVVTVAVTAGWVAWLYSKRMAWHHELARWIYMVIGGAPYLFYSSWVVNNHPVLAQWNAQNFTPAPSLVDLIVSLSPALLLAVWGMVIVFRRIDSDKTAQYLPIWIITGLLIMYLPLNLQRRLISGLYIPIAGLSVFALLILHSARLKRLAVLLLIIFSLPTNLLILAGEIRAVQDKDPGIYVYTDELAAFDWLEINAARHSLVIAAPETGLLVPAYTSERVIYGHPFETVNAEARLNEVRDFYSGGVSTEEASHLLDSEGVDYIFYGPREKELGTLPALNNWEIVFEEGEVQIFAPVD